LRVDPYGSYVNNFLIDSGDIDICIVPKIKLHEFYIYLEKIKEFIVTKKMGDCKLTHTNNRYLLIKIIDHETNYVVDITVHSILPILNSKLLYLYSIIDQRFHILGLYLKYWSKLNKIHGAADNYLSSYAILLMLIHFLQKIIEPKILPNLQIIENKEKIYEYSNGGCTLKTNIYFEKDKQKIKNHMKLINNNQTNKESISVLLVKFFEYYSYYFDYNNQKISIHKELNETIKSFPDNIGFTMDDPFDISHNPGKSMTMNSPQFNKFLTAMKKEINFILNGEYLKRLD